MSTWSKFGIKSKGQYLFYTVGEDSAVIIAIKRSKKLDSSNVVIPEKIGKYIVRGISTPDKRAEVMLKNGFSWKGSWEFYNSLRNYVNFNFFESCTFPKTVEYIGILPEGKNHMDNKTIHDCFVFPKNVSYIENSKIPAKTLVLPKDIKYIGKVAEPGLLENIFTDNESCSEGVPHYSLGQYRGEKDETELFHSKIVEKAFCDHNNLKNIILPDGIKEIDEYTFSYIGEVEQFHFPKSLEKVSSRAFIMTKLTGTFKYPSDFPVGLEDNNYNFEITGKILVEDLAQLENMMKSKNSNDKSFAEFASVLDLSSLEGKLPDRAFYKEKETSVFRNQTIMLGDNITEIGESAFEGSPINSLKLPSKLLSIRKNAFKGCPRLTKLELPDSLEIVEEGAFETKCDLLITATAQTLAMISEQKGYLEYSQKIAALNNQSNEFIEKYKDYFDGKKTKNVPDIYDLVKNWTDYGQNSKIYEKLISLLKVAPIDKKVFDKLIDRAQSFGLNSEAEEFKRIMNTRVLRLSQSKLPSDWLTLYRFNYKNSDAVYKIVEYLLMRYERGAPERLLRYIDNFMNTNRNIPRFAMLDMLYVKKVGNRGYEDSYWDLSMVGEMKIISNLFDLDRGLINACKKACEEKSPYAYLLCELAVAFSPSFKPPKCLPRPKMENAKPQNAAFALGKSYTSQSFGLDFGFSNTDTASTYSGTSSFKYTDEERQRAQEIISEAAAQKDAETYVAYLLGDIDTSSNLGSLVEKFSGIDWSEHGDV